MKAKLGHVDRGCGRLYCVQEAERIRTVHGESMGASRTAPSTTHTLRLGADHLASDPN
jgi:hypothetical protein